MDNPKLTELEKAVLEMTLDKPGEPYETIRQQLAHARITARELTGVGFMTSLEVPADSPARRDLPDMHLGDVGAELPGVKHGAGFVLFIENGVVCQLEGFTYDDPWPDDVDIFSLFRLPQI